MKQFFDSKRYLNQNGRKVAHVHEVNGTYYFHGHHKTMFKGVKKTFDTAVELETYIKQHGLEHEEQKQLTLF
ncbi:TPA: SAV1978 family virulence-associated passenger protein [Staphylococcus aureus]